MGEQPTAARKAWVANPAKFARVAKLWRPNAAEKACEHKPIGWPAEIAEGERSGRKTKSDESSWGRGTDGHRLQGVDIARKNDIRRVNRTGLRRHATSGRADLRDSRLQ